MDTYIKNYSGRRYYVIIFGLTALALNTFKIFGDKITHILLDNLNMD